MIISKKKKFVFVRVLKTGSTSAQAMITHSGIIKPADIVTGYRNDVNDEPTPDQNIPTNITADMIRNISPYPIPTSLPIKGDGIFPLLGHLTPTEMVKLKLLTKKQLESYTVIGVVRDPVDRFLSAGFFGMSLYNQEPTNYNVVTAIESRITNQELPMAFLGKTQRNFFEFNGELLSKIKVIDYAQLNTQISDFVGTYGGNISQTETLKNQYRPDWAKRPYTDWLPSKTITKIRNMMTDDVVFYNDHKT
jgi:hypothetical protein